MSLSAQMSFYFVLAMFPFFIVLAALVGALPFTGLWNAVLTWSIHYLPASSRRLMFETIFSVTKRHREFLSLGLFGMLWASTGGLLSLMQSLNVVYGVKETRNYVWRLAYSLLMIFVLAFLFLCTFGLITAGSWLSAWAAAHGSPARFTSLAWHAGHWGLSFLLTAVAVDLIDNTFPNHKMRWRWITPGMVFTVIALEFATWALNFYIAHAGTYGRTYGALSTFVILMIWVYISSGIILLGAEINWHFGRRMPG